MLFIILITVCSISWSYATNIVRQSSSGVELIGVGEADLVLSGKLSFSAPRSCTGFFLGCYITEAMTDDRRLQYANGHRDCPSNTCVVTVDFAKSTEIYLGAFDIIKQADVITATFNTNDKRYCPLQTLNGRQKFTVINMPSCSVTMIGASLPPVEPKVKESDESDSHKETSSTEMVQKDEYAFLYWVIPLCVVIAVLVLVIGALAIIFKWPCKKSDAKNVPQPAHRDPEQPKVAPKSAIPIPTATMPKSIPPVSRPPTVIPMPPMTDAVSPSVITPPQALLSQGERVKKEKKPRPSAVTTVTEGRTKTSTAKSISPPFEPVHKFREDPLRYLRRVPDAVNSSHSGSEFGPLMETAYADYAPFAEPRIIVDWEVLFFLQIVSDAMKDIDGLLKTARQELCRHGAIFSHRRLISMKKATYRYIRRRDTPGFIAWYAFACQYGNMLKVPDDKEGDALLETMTVPTLLMLFYREDIEIEVRRKAYARLRRLMVQLASMYPLHQLKGDFYPICLIPALMKMNRRHFMEGAADKTYSTPYEMLHQLHKYRASATTDEGNDDDIDETQVSFSDGKKREVVGSMVLLGTQLTPSTTVQEDLF